jgi:hypothetical protein
MAGVDRAPVSSGRATFKSRSNEVEVSGFGGTAPSAPACGSGAERRKDQSSVERNRSKKWRRRVEVRSPENRLCNVGSVWRAPLLLDEAGVRVK